MLGIEFAIDGSPLARFQNLDFEFGSTPPDYDVFDTNPTERHQILPGWTTYFRNPAGIEDDLNSYGTAD